MSRNARRRSSLRLVAQFLGVDFLVEFLGEDAIVDLLVEIVEGAVGAAGLAGRLGILIEIVGHFLVRHLGAVHLAFFHLLLRGLAFISGRRIGTGLFLDLFFLGLVGARLLLVGFCLLAFRLVIVVAEFLRHLHGGQHLAHQPRKRLLVANHLGKVAQVAGGLVLDEVAPQVENLAGTGRWFFAGQLFAHQKGDGFGKRCIVLRVDARKIRLGIFFRVHGLNVGGHARHAQRTDGFHPRLLNSVEDQPRLGTLRRHHRMGVSVMAGKAKRHGIAKATGDGDFLRGGFLGNFRQAHALSGKLSGRSLAKTTSTSASPATDRTHPAIA